LNVDVVGASRPNAAQAGGKTRELVGSKKPPTPWTISTRKNPQLVAGLQKMGINIYSPRENSHANASSAGLDPEMVASFCFQNLSTSAGPFSFQPSFRPL
jgi:hypothetical protein